MAINSSSRRGCREDHRSTVQESPESTSSGLQLFATARSELRGGRRGRRLWRPNLLMGLLMSAMGVLLFLGIVSAFF
jgi:hypothetical protein